MLPIGMWDLEHPPAPCFESADGFELPCFVGSDKSKNSLVGWFPLADKLNESRDVIEFMQIWAGSPGARDHAWGAKKI